VNDEVGEVGQRAVYREHLGEAADVGADDVQQAPGSCEGVDIFRGISEIME
jgi:hypothetical protein